jgi:hypothetical protein
MTAKSTVITSVHNMFMVVMTLSYVIILGCALLFRVPISLDRAVRRSRLSEIAPIWFCRFEILLVTTFRTSKCTGSNRSYREVSVLPPRGIDKLQRKQH